MACLRCEANEDLTRDHVISRVYLRDQLEFDDYQRWGTAARKVNIQKLCRSCNNAKGHRNIDYREDDRSLELLELCDEWGIDVEWHDDDF